MEKNQITDYQEWLEKEPEENEVFESIIVLDNGKKLVTQYIPVAIVEDLLDHLTDKYWDSTSFKFKKFEADGKEFVSGSLELTVNYDDRIISRSGAATENVADLKAKNADEKDNTSFEATILSLALCNAAKKLGNRFGRSLNGRGVLKVQEDKKESLSEIETEIAKVSNLIVEGKTYDNAKYLLNEVYPHLKNNMALKLLAETFKYEISVKVNSECLIIVIPDDLHTIITKGRKYYISEINKTQYRIFLDNDFGHWIPKENVQITKI